ncbi:carboxymuconolactone decarboxylase family protein [Streptomyces sp. NPDC007084]|uniref:carboxymuconolactone decarboxylase family protein n=1 Tax=Streptomyces sp. NPDC007084 TaxID=3154313 RepID=UPI003451157B
MAGRRKAVTDLERALKGEVLAGQRFVAENDPAYMELFATFLSGSFGRSDNQVDQRTRELLIIAIQAVRCDLDIVRSHIRRSLAIGTPPKMILETLEIAGLAGGVGALYSGAAVLAEELREAGLSL